MSLKAYEMTISCKTTLKVGDMLNNKWVILGFIEMGRMGEVYRAHQTNLNRDVAIKVISSEWLEPIDESDDEAETLVQRFRRVVQSMVQISHPKVLQVYDYLSFVMLFLADFPVFKRLTVYRRVPNIKCSFSS